MADKPFFSVVMPVYNKKPHIPRSITSILKQTYGDYEIIIINDASTDGSLELIKTFSDQRIRLLNRDKPGPGGYAARNLGIKEAKSKWVAFLDADDEWQASHLENLRGLIDEFPGIYLYGCGWLNVHGVSVKEDHYFLKHYTKGPHVIDLERYLVSCINKSKPVCVSVACINKESAVAGNLFPEDYNTKVGGDLHAWLKLICHHKKMAWGNYIGAKYHQNSVNMVTRNNPFTPNLLETNVFNYLAKGLNRRERILLKKYFNRRLRNGWLDNIMFNQDNFKLHHYLFWTDDAFYAFSITVMSFLPLRLLKALIKLKMKMNSI